MWWPVAIVGTRGATGTAGPGRGIPPPLAGGGGAKRRSNRKTPPLCLPRLPGEVARSAGGTERLHLFASPACRGRWRGAPEEPEDSTFLPPPLAGGGGAKRRRNRKTPPFCLPRLPGEVARSAGGTGRHHLFASPACRGRWREAPEEPEDTTFLPPPLAGGGGAKRRRGRPYFMKPR